MQTYLLFEWPSEQSVEVSLHNDKEEGQVGAATHAVTVQVDTHAHLVSVLTGVESWTIKKEVLELDSGNGQGQCRAVGTKLYWLWDEDDWWATVSSRGLTDRQWRWQMAQLAVRRNTSLPPQSWVSLPPPPVKRQDNRLSHSSTGPSSILTSCLHFIVPMQVLHLPPTSQRAPGCCLIRCIKLTILGLTSGRMWEFGSLMGMSGRIKWVRLR